MPKRKLHELQDEGDLTPIAKKSCDTTTTSTTASPASPTECASTSCIPGTAVDESLPGCSSDTSGPSTSTQGGTLHISLLTSGLGHFYENYSNYVWSLLIIWVREERVDSIFWACYCWTCYLNICREGT